MRVIGKIYAIWRIVIDHNWPAIIYFNFKMLPISQAIKLPFDFYHSIRFKKLSGKIIIDTDKIYRGMIKIGGRGSEMFPRCQSIVDIGGDVIFKGVCEFGHGVLIRVDEGGRVEFGSNVRLGAMTKLFCRKYIKFGSEIDFSWECQIFDTNFHYTVNTATGKVDDIAGAIKIGDRNWFGNRVTAMKGCQTPCDTIVASNSLCNKDYSALGSNVVIGGTPAKLLRKNVKRLFEGVDDILIARVVDNENMCAADVL